MIEILFWFYFLCMVFDVYEILGNGIWEYRVLENWFFVIIVDFFNCSFDKLLNEDKDLINNKMCFCIYLVMIDE